MSLPPNVKTHIKAAALRGHALRMHESATNISNANNVVRSSMARQVDEPSPQQARAIDKILRLPG